MYSFMNGIFSDKTGGNVFNCFGPWHWFYIIFTIGTIALAVLLFKNKTQHTKTTVVRVFIDIAFVLYMADFFLMPFAYGEIDVDKLPFHACTAMCVMCFICNNNKFFRRYRLNYALIALISGLMYVVYPSGVMAYEIHPLSYRVIQTMLFHSIMVIHCVLAIIFDHKGLNIKKFYREVVILLIMTAWAFIGNTLYSGSAENGYSRDFNWFFIKRDALYVLPESISPYIAPFANIVAFLGMELIIYLIYYIVKKQIEKKSKI